MPSLTKPFSEWLFISVLAALCCVLTAMQYRWTGSLARAEVDRLSADFAERVQKLADEFDSQLDRACGMLVPSSDAVIKSGFEKAHLAAWQEWRTSGLPSFFSRVAVVVWEEGVPTLYDQNLSDGSLKPGAWPSEWQQFRASLERKTFVPMEDPWGLVFEAPLLEVGLPPPWPIPTFEPPLLHEIGVGASWVIFEMDENHLRMVILPELEKRHLSIKEHPLGSIRVTALRDRSKVLYISDGSFPGGKSTETDFNSLGCQWMTMGARRGAWRLEAVRRMVELERMAAATRWRNLTIALVPNMLIIASVVLFVRHTRGSRQLARQQMQFVATVSHELRTPLTVIKGAVHNLQRGIVNDPSRVTRYLDVISRSADDLAEMVEQILERAGARKAARESSVLLPGVLSAAVEACRAEIHEAGCELETAVPENLPVVKGDAGELQRAVQNLLLNAAKHASQGQWIGLAVRVNGVSAALRVEITVTDRGPGIPKNEQAGIFEPFVRGSAAQKVQIRGSGLGLAVVRDIAAAHGGEVHLESSPEGSTFTLMLPATLASDATHVPPAQNSSRRRR